MGRDRVRARLIGRFGSEAADVLDEFMSYALAAEKAGLHGLQVFVETLTVAAPELKRELAGGQDEVRIMTVHGAKGLEANMYFSSIPAVHRRLTSTRRVSSASRMGATVMPRIFSSGRPDKG